MRLLLKLTSNHRFLSLKAVLVRLWDQLCSLAGLDQHTKEVVKQASIALSLRVIGACLSFGLNVALARYLGAAATGAYFLALTVISLGALVGRLGLDNAVLRFTAESAALEDWTRIVGLYRRSIAIAIIGSIIVTAILIALASWIAQFVFKDPSLGTPMRLMAVSILPLSLGTLHTELLRGLKRISESTLLLSVSVPLLSMIFLIILGSSFGVLGAVTAYTLSNIVTVVLGITLWRRATPHLRSVAGQFDTRLLLHTAISMFWISLLNLGMNMSDTVLLGIFAESRSVGIYGVVVRTASLTSFILVAVNTIIAPKFAALYAQGDREALRVLARGSTKVITLVALPLLLLFITIPKQILGLFGSEFSEGAFALRLLATGQFVNVATGSVGYLLMMTGHERLMQYNLTMVTALNITLGLILIPRYGIIGAALSTSLSIAVLNIVSVILAYKKLSILTLPLKLE